MRLTDLLCVSCESDSGELPAFFRLKKIAVGAADVRAGGGTGTTAQDVLVAHEFAVVFARRSGSSAVAAVRRVGAARPFPRVAKHLVKLQIVSRSRHWLWVKSLVFDKITFDRTIQCSAFPFELCCESLSSKVGVRVGLEIGDVCDRLGLIDRA